MRAHFSLGRLSLIGQVAISVYGVLLLVTSLVFVSAVSYVSSNLHEELSIRLKGRLVALMLISRNAAVVGDYASIEEALETQATLPDTDNVSFADKQQHRLIRWGKVRKLHAPGWFVHWLGIGTYRNSQMLEVSGHPYGSIEVTISPNRLLNEAWEEIRMIAVLALLAYIITALTIFMVLRRGLRPLEQLAHLASRIANGDYSTRIAPASCRELNDVIDASNQMASALQQMVDNLHTQTEELRNAKRLAERANLAKSNFLSTMSHEIRTPLNVIIGLTHLMDRNHLNSAQQNDLRSIESSSHNLLTLINNILDFSKIESGELLLESRPFRLGEVLNDVEQMFQRLALNRGLQLTLLPLAAELQVPLRGDSTRLKQMLINLVGNALKFTQQGEVQVRTQRLWANPEDGTMQVRIAVSDSGIGIQPWELPTLFSPFKQADSSTTRRYGGSGLGLSIVKQLADLMGGNIRVDSIPGQGSTFTLELPFPPASGELLPSQAKRTLTRASIAGLRVLVVDDVTLNLQVAGRMLSQQGAVPTLCDSGAQALRLLQSHPQQYDLILMDLQMPQLDGYDTTRLIREQLHLSLPVIALTASATTTDQQRALSAGMVDFLSKPIEPGELLQVLCQHIAAPHPLGTQDTPDAAADAPDEWPSIEGISQARARKLFGDDSAFFLDLLAQFLPDGQALQHRIQQLLQAQEHAEAGRQLHKLKGLLGNIAADAALQATITLEQAIHSGQDTAAAARAFQQGLTQLLQSCAIWLEQHPAPTPLAVTPTHPSIQSPLLPMLAILEQHLRHQRMDAADLARDLVAQLQGSALAEDAAHLKRGVDRLEYAEALMQLSALQAKLASSDGDTGTAQSSGDGSR